MTGPLTLTAHPIQRTGAWAAAALADREHPSELTETDLRQVAAEIVADLCAAASAESGTPAYDWWKVQYAQFPNTAPTHPQRAKWPDRDQRIAAILEPGDPSPGRSCVFCDAPASARWAKDMLPLFDSARAQNTLPPDGLGWPVCWGCRVAVWAMPYGAMVNPGSAALITGGSDELEREFSRRNVRYSGRIRTVGFGKTARGMPERLVVQMLRRVPAREAVTLWVFKNDNQEPWLRVSEARRPVARFVRDLPQYPAAARGWVTLCRILQRRDKDGVVIQPGEDVAARTLFEPSGRPHPVLLEKIVGLVTGHPDRYRQEALLALAALARHYAKEMLTMDLATVLPAAKLLARWIAAASSRGRFNEYAGVALRPYLLGRLLMQAEARLLLDRGPAEPPLPMRAQDAQHVLAATADGAVRRMLLFFAVVDELVEHGVEIGTGAKADGDDEVPVEEVLRTDKDLEDEEEYA